MCPFVNTTDTEMAILLDIVGRSHGHITSCSHGLHESLGSKPGDDSQFVHKVILDHTNAGLLDTEGEVGLVQGTR